MSIRGIDTQIMINRTTDMARDASAMMKRPEVNQDILAAQQKLSDAQDQTRVKGTEQSEMETIRADEDGGSGSEYEGDGKGRNKDGENNEDVPKSMLVPRGNNIIDIKV